MSAELNEALRFGPPADHHGNFFLLPLCLALQPPPFLKCGGSTLGSLADGGDCPFMDLRLPCRFLLDLAGAQSIHRVIHPSLFGAVGSPAGSCAPRAAPTS